MTMLFAADALDSGFAFAWLRRPGMTTNMMTIVGRSDNRHGFTAARRWRCPGALDRGRGLDG